MRIDAIELFQVAGEPRDAVLVRLDAGGSSGWGEAAVEPAPIESEQWAAATLAFIERCIAPAIVGRDVPSADALAEVLGQFRGHSLAKGAVDCAWHDLGSRLASKPLWKNLGASGRDVTFLRPFGVRPTVDVLIDELNRAMEGGLTEAMLKLRPGWGIDVVRAIRAAFPSLSLRVDFDGATTLDQRDLLFRLQDYQVTAIEQPLDPDDLVGHAMLQESLRVPICLDQSITSAERARIAIDLGACRELRMSPDLCGGFTEAREILAICRETGTGAVFGSRGQSQIGRRQVAALAMLGDDNATVAVDFADAKGDRGAVGREFFSVAGSSEVDDRPSSDSLREVARFAVRIA